MDQTSSTLGRHTLRGRPKNPTKNERKLEVLPAKQYRSWNGLSSCDVRVQILSMLRFLRRWSLTCSSVRLFFFVLFCPLCPFSFVLLSCMSSKTSLGLQIDLSILWYVGSSKAACFRWNAILYSKLLLIKPGLPACAGPVVECVCWVGGIETGLIGWPEPTVDVLWEKVWPVTSVEIAQSTRGPEVLHI